MGFEGSTMLEPVWRGVPTLDPAAAAGHASCSLPARLDAVKGAREFTCATLEQWEMPDLFDDVSLVVSELVTNALRHALPGTTPGGPLDGRPADALAVAHEALVRLHLMRWASRLVCAVRDPSEASPRSGEAGHSEESGRGLFLVDAFSDNWGWHPLAGTLRGKVVWALFHLPRR